MMVPVKGFGSLKTEKQVLFCESLELLQPPQDLFFPDENNDFSLPSREQR